MMRIPRKNRKRKTDKRKDEKVRLTDKKRIKIRKLNGKAYQPVVCSFEEPAGEIRGKERDSVECRLRDDSMATQIRSEGCKQIYEFVDETSSFYIRTKYCPLREYEEGDDLRHGTSFSHFFPSQEQSPSTLMSAVFFFFGFYSEAPLKCFKPHVKFRKRSFWKLCIFFLLHGQPFDVDLNIHAVSA